MFTMNYGNISLYTCKNLTRDNGKGTIENIPDSSDICYHSDNNDTYSTAIAWIIHPQSLTIYLTHTQPCKDKFTLYNITTTFKN